MANQLENTYNLKTQRISQPSRYRTVTAKKTLPSVLEYRIKDMVKSRMSIPESIHLLTTTKCPIKYVIIRKIRI